MSIGRPENDRWSVGPLSVVLLSVVLSGLVPSSGGRPGNDSWSDGPASVDRWWTGPRSDDDRPESFFPSGAPSRAGQSTVDRRPSGWSAGGRLGVGDRPTILWPEGETRRANARSAVRRWKDVGPSSMSAAAGGRPWNGLSVVGCAAGDWWSGDQHRRF